MNMEKLDAALDKADLGDVVNVWVEGSTWMTDFGPVARTYVEDESLAGVGPTIMITRSRTADIYGNVPQPLDTNLRFDERNRLYLTVNADNGSWTWRLLRSEYLSDVDGLPSFIGRWPD